MKKISFLALSAFVLCGSAAAEGVGLSAKASSLGLGIDINKAFSPSWNGRLGVDSYNYSKSLNKDGIDYDASFKWQSAHLLADWFPGQGVFRTSVGLVYNNNKLSLTARPDSSGLVTIGGNQYDSTQLGSLSGSVDFKKSAPYLGIGWGNPVASGKGWGFVADLGVMYQGSPRVNLTANCGSAIVGTSACTTLQSDTATQQNTTTNDINSFKWYPVFSIGASYQF